MVVRGPGRPLVPVHQCQRHRRSRWSRWWRRRWRGRATKSPVPAHGRLGIQHRRGGNEPALHHHGFHATGIKHLPRHARCLFRRIRKVGGANRRQYLRAEKERPVGDRLFHRQRTAVGRPRNRSGGHDSQRPRNGHATQAQGIPAGGRHRRTPHEFRFHRVCEAASKSSAAPFASRTPTT